MESEDPRVIALWYALHLVGMRYAIGEAIAQGRELDAFVLLGLYPNVAVVGRAAA